MIVLHVVHEALPLSAALLLPQGAGGIYETPHHQSGEDASENRDRNLTKTRRDGFLVVLDGTVLRVWEKKCNKMIKVLV